MKLKLSDDLSKIQKLFSGRLYQDRYTFIQEIVSNAKDSHTRAGQEKPVEVSLYYTHFVTNYPLLSSLVFEVRDYGTGLTQEEFCQKIGIIAYSDKEDNPAEIGKMGIGSISWAAYHNRCEFICRKDGVEFTATMKETDNDGIIFEMSDKKETDEPNGVIFKISVKDPLIGFKAKILQKLAYFTNIWYNFNNDVRINTEIKIVRSDNFQISNIYDVSEVHLTLDDVVYPINWAKLGIAPIPNKLALRFQTNEGLEATITRESIQYTDEVIEKIKQKLTLVSDWFVDKWNNEHSKVKTLSEYHAAYGKARTIDINTIPIYVDILTPYSDKKCNDINIEGFSNLYLRAFFSRSHIFTSLFIGDKGRIFSAWRKGIVYEKKSYESLSPNKALEKVGNYYLVDEKLKREKIKYLKSLGQPITFFEVLPRTLKKYRQLLDLKDVDKTEWRNAIKQFQKIENLYLSNFKKLSDIQVSEEFKKSIAPVRKKKIVLEKLEGQVGIKLARRSMTSSGCVFEENVYNLADLSKINKFHIYTTNENRHLHAVLFDIKKKQNFTLALVSDKVYTTLEKLKFHNFMSVDKFLEGDHKIFRQIITGHIVNKFINSNQSLFKNQDIIKDYISEKYSSDLKELQDYGKRFDTGYISNPSFLEATLKLAEDKKLYDFSIYEKLQNVKEYKNRFEFIEFFADKLNQTPNYRLTEEQVNLQKQYAKDCIKDICKQRKIKMDWKHYKDYGQIYNVEKENIKPSETLEQ